MNSNLMCHFFTPDVYITSSFINLRLPLTDVSGGGVVFVPGPGCPTLGQKCPKISFSFLMPAGS